MDRKSIEWQEYKLEIYKRRGMTACIANTRNIIAGIEAKAELLKRAKPSGI